MRWTKSSVLGALRSCLLNAIDPPFAPTKGGMAAGKDRLKPRINWLALQGQDAEDAFMHPAQRLLADETLQPLDPESEFAESK